MMEYMVINSNMGRSPTGERGDMSMGKENGSASRCGAMSKNANSTGDDAQAFHSMAKNDKEEGIPIPEQKSNDEEELLEKTVTTCGMAREVPEFFRTTRPTTKGFIEREDGSFEVTDLPHFMRLLDLCGPYFQKANELRDEARAVEEMMRGKDTEVQILPLNWGTFLRIPLDWINVRETDRIRKVSLRYESSGVLDLELSRIFTQCEAVGFNEAFFEELTSCMGWQNPTKDTEAFAMFLSFCAMAKVILTSKVVEGMQDGAEVSDEEQLEAYEELTKVLWMPTIEPKWLRLHFREFLAKLHSTAAWAMTVHLIGQLEALGEFNPQFQINAISKALQQQIIVNEAIASPPPAIMTARFNGVSKRVGGQQFNPMYVDGEDVARAGGFLSPRSAADTFETRASSPSSLSGVSFGNFEEGEVEAIYDSGSTSPVADVPIALTGEQVLAVENLQDLAPQTTAATAEAGREESAVEYPSDAAAFPEAAAANVPIARMGEQVLAVENLQDPAPQATEATPEVERKSAVEYPPDAAAFFATLTDPPADVDRPVEDLADPVEDLEDISEMALVELEVLTRGYLENRSMPGAEDTIQKRAMEEGPRLVLEGLLKVVLDTEEDKEAAVTRAAAHAFVLDRWNAAEQCWRDNVDRLVRASGRRYNVLTLLLEIQNTWPHVGARE